MFQLRHALRAVREQIRRQPHRRLRREDVVPARDVLLQDVVLHRAAQLRRSDALLLRHQLVQQEQQRRGRVDRHRRRHLAQRDAAEENRHVRERVDRDAGAADLAERAWIVGVVAQLRRQVERDRQARLPLVEQIAVALVRLLRRREARVLADRPRPPAVHVRIGPTRVRELARRLERPRRVVGGVDRLHLDAGLRAPIVRGGHGTNRRLRNRRARRRRRGCAAPRRPARPRRRPRLRRRERRRG